MKHEELNMDDFKGTAALSRAADNIIMFTRERVEDDDRKPCIIYRSKPRPDGTIEFVEVGRCFVGDIVDCEALEPEPVKIQNRVVLTVDFPGFLGLDRI